MKIFLLIITTVFIQFLTFSQPCLPEGITFTTQEEIDSFQVNYPGCAEIEGHVHIFGSDITNLNGLSIVTNIGENLHIIGSLLTNLTGLDNLTYIGGDLNISGNGVLNQLTGLGSLITIQGSLKMGLTIGPQGNPSLTNFNGLDNLTTIGEDFKIIDHDSLTGFTGLENLVSIGGSLHVGFFGPPSPYGNPSLISFDGLNNLSSISGDVQIMYNPSLTSLYGLGNLDANSINNLYINNNDTLSTCEVQSICDLLVSPNGTVEIYDNASGCNNPEEIQEACQETDCLPDGIIFTTQAQIDYFQVNHPNCSEIEGDVIVNGDDITSLAGLNVLTVFGGSLKIYGNNSLTSLAGLESITYVNGDLHIGDNSLNGGTMLTNLAGLQNLSFVGGTLLININLSLTSLYGLENLNSIGGDLEIGHVYSNGGGGNPVLVDLSGLEGLTTIGGNLKIMGNDSLTNISGLNNLISIAGTLRIGGSYEWEGNPSLGSLTGLESIDPGSITDLYVYGNESLYDCDVQSICEYLASPNGTIEIYNNAPGCNSQQEVEEACNSCLTEGITFTTQEEIDNFQTNYPGCTEIEGDVQINGDDINSLMGLDILTAFEGDLLIGDNTIYPYGSNPLLTNLEGFENVADIGGSLRIFGNDTLASISGLSNLTTIGGCLQINHNYILASLTGLGNLISIGGYLSIINNAELTNIADLGNLNSIGSESGISLWIIGNNKLTGLWGLEGLTALEGDLRICSNSILSSIEGLENLTSVEGNVRIGYFDPVFGGSGNPLLINLSGLISLISIGGDLIIADNDVLTTLDGLENLNFIGGNLMIGRGEPGNSGGNPLLTDISGLYNIDPASIEGLSIIFNSSLSQCNVQSVCAYLANPTGFVQINNNAPGCNSPEQVDSICNIVSISEIVLGNEFVISPNPNSGSVNLRFVIGEQGLVICDLLNISGVKVKSFFNEMKKSGTHEMEIDLKNIPAGVYFCVLKTNKGIQTKKIVKL